MRKLILISGALSLALIAAVAIYAFKDSQTGGDIKSLSRNGADEAAMVAAIEKSASPYNLSANDIIGLMKDGVPDSVVVKMINHKVRWTE